MTMYYKVVEEMGWVDFDFGCCLPNSACADGNLAESARHPGNMVEDPI